MTTRIDRETVSVDMNGHAGTTTDPADISHWRHMNDWHKEQGIDREYPLSLGLMSRWECSNCLVYPDYEFTDEAKTAIRAVQSCANPDGFTTITELTVTSGKIVCDDDLRDVYDIPDEIDRTFASYNTAVGQRQVILENEKMGCAYGPVGNSSPGLYRTGEDTYIIANPAYDDDYEIIEQPTWEWLAGFVTDLWAYSIADYGDFISKGGNPDHPCRTVIDFPNGTYRFAYHGGETGFDHEGDDGNPVIYTHIERIS